MHAARGGKVIMSPGTEIYLDMKYDSATVLGLRWAGLIEVPMRTTGIQRRCCPSVRRPPILGVEAPLWSETLVKLEDYEFMAFPRLLAIAEVGVVATGRAGVGCLSGATRATGSEIERVRRQLLSVATGALGAVRSVLLAAASLLVITGEPPRFTPIQPDLLGAGSTLVNAWADYDGDGDLDLFVGFNGTANRLYRNDAGSCSTWPRPWVWLTRVQHARAPWGDFDGDGDPDFVIGFAPGPQSVLRAVSQRRSASSRT